MCETCRGGTENERRVLKIRHGLQPGSPEAGALRSSGIAWWKAAQASADEEAAVRADAAFLRAAIAYGRLIDKRQKPPMPKGRWVWQP